MHFSGTSAHLLDQFLMKKPELIKWMALAILMPLSLSAEPIRVLVWDEQQPRQKPVYPNFIGNHIAEHLNKNDALEVTSAHIDQPETGLSKAAIDGADVLVYWGHVRHDDVSQEISDYIVDRIQAGQLAMLTLHSAHWASPFRTAMEARLVQDTLAMLPLEHRADAEVQWISWRNREVPTRNEHPNFTTRITLKDDGQYHVLLERPNCVFPSCCTPVQPSQIRTILPDHPIAEGIPTTFTIGESEMYDEPFHVPTPDHVIFDETWSGGEYFRSGMLWQIGEGEVFYFRPGHETYRVLHEPLVLKIIENATAYLGTGIQQRRKQVSLKDDEIDLLVFSKTSWYRHPAIPIVNDTLTVMGDEFGFKVTVTEEGADFNSSNLSQYDVVLFNNTTDIGKSLNSDQKEAFVQWFRAGGGLISTHAAGVHHDTWDWYSSLIGTDFDSDSEYVPARIHVDEQGKSHPLSHGLESTTWLEGDWLNFKKSVRGLSGVTVLLRLDEGTYDAVRAFFDERGGKAMGDDHPIAWARAFEGGRFVYTGIGHDARPIESDFGTQHLLNAIRWAAGK